MLKGKDIYTGQYIWYGGETSMSAWSCPARIIDVDSNSRTFRVVSLDDMKEQSQLYNFDITERTPDSRKSMRLVNKLEVEEYLRKRRVNLDVQIIELEMKVKKLQETKRKFSSEIDKVCATSSVDPY